MPSARPALPRTLPDYACSWAPLFPDPPGLERLSRYNFSSSSYQAALPQVREHQAVEGHLVAGEQAADAAARAELVQGRAVGRQVLLVAAQQRGAGGDLRHVVVLGVDQLQVA